MYLDLNSADVDGDGKCGTLWFKSDEDEEMKKVFNRIDINTKWCLAVSMIDREECIQIVE